jgi:HK97 family phage prohead protease
MSADWITRLCERKFVNRVVDELESNGSFSGYASLFGRVDLGRDVVERGAFAKSLRTRGAAGVRMLFQHDPREPIGTWTELREDARGLFVRGRLTEGVSRSKEVLNLIRGGALDGLSIGFRAIRAKNDGASGVRRILEADLWEISVVTFPMMPDARVERINGFGRGRPLSTTREFERWLTRDGGLTRGDARGGYRQGLDNSALTDTLLQAVAAVAGAGGGFRQAFGEKPHRLSRGFCDVSRPVFGPY